MAPAPCHKPVNFEKNCDMKKVFVLGLFLVAMSAAAFSQQTNKAVEARKSDRVEVKKEQTRNTIQQKRVKTEKVILPVERRKLQQRRIDTKKEALRQRRVK